MPEHKKNRTVQTLYSRDVLLWERARRRAARNDESFSQYVEKLLRDDEKKRAEGLEFGNLVELSQ